MVHPLALHRDSIDNFSIQVIGAKEWVVFPPMDSPYLYLDDSNPQGLSFSDIDVWNSPEFNLNLFPLYKKATPLRLKFVQGNYSFCHKDGHTQSKYRGCIHD